MKLFHSFFKSFFQTPSRVLRIWLLQQLWISNYFAQETMQTFDFQPNSYSFQTIGTNVFPPELASANKFPEFPSRCEISCFCPLFFCQIERTQLCSVCILFGESVFIFQFLKDKIHNYFKQNVIVNFINQKLTIISNKT